VGLEAGYGLGYDESYAATLGGEIDAEVEDLYQVKATASQLLFSWGKISGAIEAAAKESERAAIDRAAVERSVKYAVHLAFNDALLAKRLVTVAEETLAQKERHLDTAKKRYDAGVVNRLEVLRSETEVANARVPVIEAKNSVARSAARMNHLLARPQDTPFSPDGELVRAEVASLTLAQVEARALEKRPEIASLRTAVEVSRLVLTIEAAGDKPELAAYGEYGYKAEDFSHLNGTREAWQAGVVLTYPLFDGGRTRGRVSQARSGVRDLELAVAEAEQSIRLEARTALDLLQESDEIVTASSLAVTQARESLRLSESAFRNGAATTLDVSDSLLALTVAEVRKATALRNHMSARAGLLAVMNEL